MLYKLNQIDDADKLLQSAISTGNSVGNLSPDTEYYAAVVASEKNRKEEAKTLLKDALKRTSPFTMKPEASALLEQLNKQ